MQSVCGAVDKKTFEGQLTGDNVQYRARHLQQSFSSRPVPCLTQEIEAITLSSSGSLCLKGGPYTKLFLFFVSHGDVSSDRNG